MQVTKEQLKCLNPCPDGWEWYLKNGGTDLLDLLLRLNEWKPQHARWLFNALMNRKQRTELAIFCAESVLPIFEDRYPEDKRPRKAIDAARVWLENPTEENRRAAAYAADAAYAAYAAAAAGAVAAVAAAAADAADAAYAAYAADAAAADAAAADAAAADADARKQLQIDIIHKAVEILDRGSDE